MKTFGGDFEFHFYDGNKAVIAENILKVDKNAYIAAETTTAEIRPRATNNLDEFMGEVREMLHVLSKYDNNLKIRCQPINKVNIDDIQNLILKPDIEGYQAYESRVERTLILPDNLRTQGGHIWICPQTKKIEQLVKLIDTFIALPLVMVFPSEDEKIRRTKYGRAGSYRQNNGLLEYRVFSSSILFHPEILRNILFYIDVINKQFESIQYYHERFLKEKVYFEKQVSSIIDNNAVVRAAQLQRRIVKFFKDAGIYYLSGWHKFIEYMALRQRQENFLHNWFIT